LGSSWIFQASTFQWYFEGSVGCGIGVSGWGVVLLEAGGIEIDAVSADGSGLAVFEWEGFVLEGFVLEGVEWTVGAFGAWYCICTKWNWGLSPPPAKPAVIANFCFLRLAFVSMIEREVPLAAKNDSRLSDGMFQSPAGISIQELP